LTGEKFSPIARWYSPVSPEIIIS